MFEEGSNIEPERPFVTTGDSSATRSAYVICSSAHSPRPVRPGSADADRRLVPQRTSSSWTTGRGPTSSSRRE